MNAYLQALMIYPVTYHLKSDKNGRKILGFLCLILWGKSIGSTMLNWMGIHILDSVWSIIPFSGYTSMLCYFILGILLFEYRENITHFIGKLPFRKSVPWAMVSIGLIGTIMIKYFDTGSIRWNGVYLTDGYNRMSTMVMAVGLYLVFSMGQLGKLEGVFCKLGKHTMGIYYLHYPVLIAFKIACSRLIESYTSYYSFGLNVLQTAIIVLLCWGITVVAKKIPIVERIFN